MKDWYEWATTEKASVYETAKRFGGSFVTALAEALNCADAINTSKILNTWPEYFEELYDFYIIDKRRLA